MNTKDLINFFPEINTVTVFWSFYIYILVDIIHIAQGFIPHKIGSLEFLLYIDKKYLSNSLKEFYNKQAIFTGFDKSIYHQTQLYTLQRTYGYTSVQVHYF